MVGRIGVLSLIGVLAAATPTSAQPFPPAAALVLEVDGPVTPALRPYREIPTGTTVALGANARLVFLHYVSCRSLTVVGGSITFTRDSLPIVKGGSTRASERGPCPRKFSASGTDAAVVLRQGGTSAPTTSATPDFILVGQRAENMAAVRIHRGGRQLLVHTLDGPHFQWPASMPPLEPGVYELELVPKEAGTAATMLKFEVAARAPEAFVLITID